jgi:hypothetical protein
MNSLRWSRVALLVDIGSLNPQLSIWPQLFHASVLIVKLSQTPTILRQYPEGTRALFSVKRWGVLI